MKRIIEIEEKDLERIREIVERENKTALKITTRGIAYITIADSKPYEDRPQGMNEILRSLIKWTEENKIIPEIYFTSMSGGIWLNLALRYHGKEIKHEFYVPGGVLCLNNWDMFPTEEEVNLFIEEAKTVLLEKGGAE